MKRKDLSKVLMPDDPMYTEAVEALKRYHEAQSSGVTGVELERLGTLTLLVISSGTSQATSKP